VGGRKCDKEKPEYRCRLAAKGIKEDRREDLLAATPPLEAKKELFSLFASLAGLCSDVIDVVRAYRCRAHVDLPEEDQQDGMCGRLKKAMRQARDASQNWDLEHSEMMTEADSREDHTVRAYSTTGRRMFAQ
jgi:hypothetical protein